MLAACPRDSPAQVVAPAKCQAPFSVLQMGAASLPFAGEVLLYQAVQTQEPHTGG